MRGKFKKPYENPLSWKVMDMDRYKTVDEMLKEVGNYLQLEDSGKVTVKDLDGFKRILPKLVYTNVFAQEPLKSLAGKIIYNTALALDIVPSSISGIYLSLPKLYQDESFKRFTTPAINLRTLSYLMARAAFKVIVSENAFPVIFELARSEMGYTSQTPLEYTANVLAAAIEMGYKGPVFIQGDHFQFSASKFKENPEKEKEAIRDLIRRSIQAGFFNIDIDASTLVDISKDDLDEQQRTNYQLTAEMTKFIREIEPEGISVAIGGEIGEVGGRNSTPEDLRAFMEGYLRTLDQYGIDRTKGIAKVSVQTGTTHGGVVLPDGSIAKVKVDFNVHKELSEILRKEYRIGGTVQHGASTLPDELFDKFPESGAIEIHLATGFQNIVYDKMPEDLKQEIYNWLKENRKHEWKEGQTEEQFLYKTRKRALGPFKEKIWSMPSEVLSEIEDALEKKFSLLFEKLGIFGRKPELEGFVSPVKVWKELKLEAVSTVSADSPSDLAD